MGALGVVVRAVPHPHDPVGEAAALVERGEPLPERALPHRGERFLAIGLAFGNPAEEEFDSRLRRLQEFEQRFVGAERRLTGPAIEGEFAADREQVQSVANAEARLPSGRAGVERGHFHLAAFLGE